MKNIFKKNSVLKMFLLLAVSAAFLLLFTGCGDKADSNKIRIAYFPNMTHAQALVGIAENTFKEAFGDEYEVTFIPFNAGPDEIEAFFADEVDIGYIGPIPAINGFATSSGDIKIIAGATNAGAVLVTRSELKLNNVSELAGKRIAVPQYGNTQHLALLSILSSNGLDSNTDVTIIESKNADTKTLMDRGEVDAACVPEPWGTRLVNEIGANILLDYDELMLDGNYSTAVVIASTKFIEEKPELVEKFLKAHIELTDKINNEKDYCKQIINDKIYELTQAKLSDDVLNTAFDKIIFSYDPAVPSIKEFMKIHISEIYKEDIKNKDDLFDFTILNKILKEKGLQEIQK